MLVSWDGLSLSMVGSDSWQPKALNEQDVAVESFTPRISFNELGEVLVPLLLRSKKRHHW